MGEITDQLKVFLKAYKTFEQTRETPNEGYMALRRLFCLTNGWFNDVFQWQYALKNPKRPLKTKRKSMVPGYSDSLVRKAVEGLRKNGFYVFDGRLPESLVQELYDFSLKTPSLHQSASGTSQELGTPFDPSNVTATNYRIPERLAVNCEAIQRLLADPALVRIAQEYLGSQIYFLNEQIWWTTPKDCDKPLSQLAQLFHFDMDRIKFMKFFVYLTDVDSESGPHCYVKGSCQRKPKQCLEDRRYPDEELAQYYGPDDFAEICAPAGTLLAVDTRGFHKAKMPTRGNRAIVQLEIANSLFGPNYGHPELIVRTPELRELMQQQPEMFRNYVIVERLTETAPAKEVVATGRY